MELPRNRFKHALAAGRQQIGLWISMPGAYATEVAAGAGYDWLLLDTEHSPNDVPGVLDQLQAVAAYPGVSPVVRPAWNDKVLVKRHLDVGRSEERRVGEECCLVCRSRWSTYH